MKKYRRVLVYVLLLTVIVCGIAIALSFANRQPREVSIRGTVTRDGKPLEWKGEKRQLTVLFFPANRGDTFNVYPADCDADKGTFSIAKIPTGSYTVSIQQSDSQPHEILPNFAFDATLKREVTRDGQQILIDLPKENPKDPGSDDKTEPK